MAKDWLIITRHVQLTNTLPLNQSTACDIQTDCLGEVLHQSKAACQTLSMSPCPRSITTYKLQPILQSLAAAISQSEDSQMHAGLIIACYIHSAEPWPLSANGRNQNSDPKSLLFTAICLLLGSANQTAGAEGRKMKQILGLNWGNISEFVLDNNIYLTHYC